MLSWDGEGRAVVAGSLAPRAARSVAEETYCTGDVASFGGSSFSYVSYSLLAGGPIWVQLAMLRTPQTIRRGQQSSGRMLLEVIVERVAARAQALLVEVMSSESY
jgi:hypothetical protein